jgi:hypothetical protein
MPQACGAREPVETPGIVITRKNEFKKAKKKDSGKEPCRNARWHPEISADSFAGMDIRSQWNAGLPGAFSISRKPQPSCSGNSGDFKRRPDDDTGKGCESYEKYLSETHENIYLIPPMVE